jgi:hypothetical protein
VTYHRAIVGGRKAFDAIVADYGLSCATVKIAEWATAGFRSPVFTFVNDWSPSHDVFSDPNRAVQYAYHTWDLSAWQAKWPPKFRPRDEDRGLSESLRGWFGEFVEKGERHANIHWLLGFEYVGE